MPGKAGRAVAGQGMAREPMAQFETRGSIVARRGEAGHGTAGFGMGTYGVLLQEGEG